jgi:predicted ATPase
MVGRGVQLRRLTALFPDGQSKAGDQGPEVALVGGEAGIGKSRLVGELLGAIPIGTSRLVGRAGQGAPQAGRSRCCSTPSNL